MSWERIKGYMYKTDRNRGQVVRRKQPKSLFLDLKEIAPTSKRCNNRSSGNLNTTVKGEIDTTTVLQSPAFDKHSLF